MHTSCSNTLPGAHRVAWHMPHRQAAGLLTHNGSCAEDPIQLPGDCTLDAYGAWPLSPAQARWSTAAQLCARRCAYCARCSAISVSLEERSCSWHSECRLDALHLLPQPDDGLHAMTAQRMVRLTRVRIRVKVRVKGQGQHLRARAKVGLHHNPHYTAAAARNAAIARKAWAHAPGNWQGLLSC